MKKMDYKSLYSQMLKGVQMSRLKVRIGAILFWFLFFIAIMVFQFNSNIHFKLGFIPGLIFAMFSVSIIYLHFYGLNPIINELEDLKKEVAELRGNLDS